MIAPRQLRLPAIALAAFVGASVTISHSTVAVAQEVNEDAIRSAVGTFFPAFDPAKGTQTFTGLNRTINLDLSGRNRTFNTADEDDLVRVRVNGRDVFKTEGGFKHIRDINGKDFEELLKLLGVDFEAAANIAQTEQSRAQAAATIRTIGRRVGAFLTPSPSGAARATAFRPFDGNGQSFQGVVGGDTGLQYGVWGNFSYAWLENEGSASQLGIDAYDGNLINGIIGGDVLINDMFMVGLALSIEDLDLDTPQTLGTLEQRGYGVTPYFGARFLDGTVVVDGLFGYTSLDTEETLLSGSFKGEFGGSRYIAAGNVTYNYLVQNFVLSPSVGINFAYEAGDSYVDNVGVQRDVREAYIGDVKAGARAAYGWNQFEFYTSHYYVWDAVPLFSATVHTGLDRDEVASTFGANWFATDQLTATVEFNNTFDRENITDRSIVGAVRYSF